MEVPINTYFKSCIENIPNYSQVIKNINITNYYTPKIIFKQYGNIYYHTPNITPQKYVAIFDIDWTLTYSQKHLFPSEEDDIFLLPNREEKLEELFKLGYTIVLITNQTSKSPKTRDKKISRIRTLLLKLKIPCFAFIGTGNDVVKPNTNMWDLFKQIVPDVVSAFFVGDALGRPQDYSDSDRVFSQNINVPFYSPQEFFKQTILSFPTTRTKPEMIVFVGMPGSGKSKYFKDFLEPTGFVEICQDNFKTKNAFSKFLLQSIKERKNVVINRTNSKQTDREVFYELAEKNGYQISVIYFVRDGRGWNNLREKPVPTIVYHLYFSSLVPPTQDNTPGNLFLLE
jgi:bifunctional polynucleotide phosphatase/kinase